MINFLLFALVASAPIQGPGHQDDVLCQPQASSLQDTSKDVTAVIEFDGLERTFISGISCPNSRSIEVVKGLSLPGKEGENLYKKILSSAKMSDPKRKYGVKFQGNVSFYRNADGDIVAGINSVTESDIEVIWLERDLHASDGNCGAKQRNH